MTGYPDFNYPAFNAAAARLRAAGIAAINPADHGVVPGATWEDYLRSDIAQLATCESIYFLPGWSQSRGALLEHHIATSLGMRLLFAEGAEPEAVRLRDELQERASQDDPDSRDPVAFARLAIDYSQNFATAKPDIGATEKEHILGLCSLVERLIAARQPVGQEAEAYLVMAVKDGVAWEHRWYVPRWGDADPTALHGTVYTIRGREHPELGIHHVKAFYAEPPVQAVDLAQLRTQVADVLRGEFDLEVADPEDHRYDDGRGEADRVAGMIVALLDSGKAVQS